MSRVTCQECEDDKKFDDRYFWCAFPHDVECGARPCPDGNVHCPAPATTQATTQYCSVTPPIDCEETGHLQPAGGSSVVPLLTTHHYLHLMLHTHHCPAGAGYFPDEYNCRKYWHCIRGTDTPKHIMCPDDADGNPEMFDLVFNGCNFDYLTHCDGRPVCDECNDNCEPTPTDAPDCTPEDQADM